MQRKTRKIIGAVALIAALAAGGAAFTLTVNGTGTASTFLGEDGRPVRPLLTDEEHVDRGRGELGTDAAEIRPTYELRYAGQAFELPVPGPVRPDPEEDEERHEARQNGGRSTQIALLLLAQRDDLRMRGGIALGDVAVPAFADHLPFGGHEQRADGNLVVFVLRALGQCERALHPGDVDVGLPLDQPLQ